MTSSTLHLLAAASTLVFARSADAENPKVIINVTDYDFVNTNVKKVCLLAAMNATIDLTRKFDNGSTKNYVVAMPPNPPTDGSYCNRDFSSLLKLTFEGNTIEMKFTRPTPVKETKQTTYCDDCNYGTWNLSRVTVTAVLEGYSIHGSSTVQNLKEHAPELSEGIGIKRSYKCVEDDHFIAIPLDIIHVANATNVTDVYSSNKNWNANLTLRSVQIQPFMVFHAKSKELSFSDPYLCRNIVVSHVLIIVLPVVYFLVFIAFHRIKHKYGCPPNCNVREKDTESTMQIDVEESTNIMASEYDTCHLGPTSSASAYG